MEEGRVTDNYTVGVQGIPICTWNGAQSLRITSQALLSAVNTTRDYPRKSYMLQASGGKGLEISAISSINLSFCEIRFTNKESDWVHWQQSKNEKPWVLIGISQEYIIDWSPYGAARGKYSQS